MDFTYNKERDVAEIILIESGQVYGNEEEPGVVLFKDTMTDELCSIELLFFSKYPDVWGQSLLKLIERRILNEK